MIEEHWNDLPLGKETQYEFEYNPGLLHPIERAHSREKLGIGAALPFKGEDIWWGFELSWLNERGKPQVAVAQFRIPVDSPNIIESKSFKLYLNSFNQSRFVSRAEVEALLANDLSGAAGAPVQVELFDVEDPALAVGALAGTCLDDLDIEVGAYQPDSGLLAHAEGAKVVEESLYSHLLKSNCPVTGQPDWATVVINYRGQQIDREKLLEYLVSFRQHQDFHEHCVERIFCDVQRILSPEKLTVCARYTRRGGLDINPLRSSEITWEVPARLARQ